MSAAAAVAPTAGVPARGVERALAEIAEVVASGAGLEEAARMIGAAIAGVFQPVRHAVVPAEAAADDGPWPRALRAPVLRTGLDDPALASVRDGCRAVMARLGAELLAPLGPAGRPTALLALGPRRCGRSYTARHAHAAGLLVRHGALALEQVSTRRRLEVALRRVDVLETIRASLGKFVPDTVRALIEHDPVGPPLSRREADLSVLFVDIVGYMRLVERLDSERAARLLERYFGAFLDEVRVRGGDVNETSGDGLMIIFEDPDPRAHARAAVEAALAVLRRMQAINAAPGGDPEPIALHIGVNSGVATLGVTRMEGRAGARWTYTAPGLVSSVAARLAALGAGNEVVVGPGTRDRLVGDFAFDEMGVRRLRNMERPVRVYRLGADARPRVAAASGAVR